MTARIEEISARLCGTVEDQRARLDDLFDVENGLLDIVTSWGCESGSFATQVRLSCYELLVRARGLLFATGDK